jgi:polyisoprenoid-binding protein YceI
MAENHVADRKAFCLTAAAALALMTLLAPLGRGQILLKPEGSLRVEGDSSLHKWSSTATVVEMSFTLAEGAPQVLSEAIKASKVASLEVKISVAGLKSGESGLDKNMLKAMNAEKYPDVVYRLGHYEMGPPAADGAMTAKTTGELTISGKTKPVTMDVKFLPQTSAVEAIGSYRLKMSDYGIKPPTLMLGSIKTRDPVTIRFDLLLKPQVMEKIH